jgi:exonuclease SbcC
MRPVRITIAGFRSFRTAQTIEFSKLGLFAIIGDTGAGKSSILEAMVYALYSKSTYDERGVKSLIALDADTMRVDFTFAVGDAQYVVTRSASTIAGRPAIHSLRAVDDKDARFHAETAVNAEIVRLTKLDYRTFTKTVVLPQGRFADLLTASGSEREPVLTALFALDEVDRVRESLLPTIAQANERCITMRAERAIYGENPALDLASVQERKSEADATNARFTSVALQCTSIKDAQERDFERKRHLDDAERRIEELDVAAQRVASLEERHDVIRAEMAAADVAHSTATNERAEAMAAMARLREDARDAESLQEVRNALCAIGDFEGRRDEDERLVGEEEAKLKERESELIAASRQLDEGEKERSATETTTRATEAAYRDAAEVRDSAAAAWYALLLARRSLREAKASHERAALEMITLTDECERAGSAATAADHAAESARQALEHAQIVNLAATIGAATHAGDICPVCTQRVPDGYVSPVDIGLEAARKAESQARRNQAETRKAFLTLRARLDQLSITIESQVRTIDSAASSEADARRAAAALEVDVSAENEVQALRSLTQTWELAKQARDAASVREREVSEAVMGSKVSYSALQSFVVETRERIAARRAGIIALCERLETSRKAIREEFRPAQTSVEVVRIALSRVDEAIEAAREIQARAAAAQVAFSATEKAVAETHQRLVIEITAVVEANIALCDDALRALQNGALGLEFEITPARSNSGVESALLWASSVRGWCDEARATTTVERGAADRRIADKQAEIVELLAAVCAIDVAQLDKLQRDAAAQVAVLADRVEKARETLEKAERSTARLAEIEPLAVGLEALKSHLDSNRFKKYLTGLRESSLLGAATDILRKMSDGRYAFAAGFQILDGQTQLTRDPKTLSGGEKFLASLALALGLVELTTRTGARLDALFLDEGFGSLDAAALDAALLELKERADSGKLIGVITHVRGIASEIEDVIRVQRLPGGSVATNLSATERDDMMNKVVASGLLEAAS